MRDKLTIANLGNGALVEKADHALHQVCENIMDTNTPADAKRVVTITIHIKPGKKRDQIAIAYAVKTTLPGLEPDAQMAYIAEQSGELGMYGYDTRQQDIPFKEEITPVGRGSAASTAVEAPKAGPAPSAN